MPETLFSFSPLIVAIIPVVVGLVEVVKKMGLDSKYAPAVAIVIGICMVWLTNTIWQEAVVQGIIAGLAAAGLYSGSMKTVSAIKGSNQ